MEVYRTFTNLVFCIWSLFCIDISNTSETGINKTVCAGDETTLFFKIIYSSDVFLVIFSRKVEIKHKQTNYKIGTYSPVKGVFVDNQLKNRYSIIQEKIGIILKINDTKKWDQGRFICLVIFDGKPDVTKEQHLIVKEKENSSLITFKERNNSSCMIVTCSADSRTLKLKKPNNQTKRGSYHELNSCNGLFIDGEYSCCLMTSCSKEICKHLTLKWKYPINSPNWSVSVIIVCLITVIAALCLGFFCIFRKTQCRFKKIIDAICCKKNKINMWTGHSCQKKYNDDTGYCIDCRTLRKKEEIQEFLEENDTENVQKLREQFQRNAGKEIVSSLSTSKGEKSKSSDEQYPLVKDFKQEISDSSECLEWEELAREQQKDLELSSEQQISDLTVTSQEEKHKYLSDIPSKQQKNQDADNYGIESNEIRMIAIGKTGAGKSATANTIVGRNVFESKAQATSLTTKCKMEICNRFDRKFVYIDTPGIFDPRKTNEQVISEIAKCIGMTVPGPHVFLYVVSTLGTFTKEDQDAVQFFEDHFGTGVYKYLIVVFTRIDELDNDGISIDEFVKNVPGKLKEILRLCDNRYVGFNNRLKGEESHLQVQLLLDKINSIIILNDNQCFTNAIYNDVEEIMRKRLDEIKNELEEKKKRDEEALRKTMSKQFEKEVIKSKEKRIKMKIKKLQLESQYSLTKVKAVKSEISDLQKQLQYSMERSDIQSEKKIIEKIQNMVMKLLQLEMQIKKQLQMKRKKEEEELDRKTKQLEEEAKDKTEKQMLEKKLKQLEEEKIENARKEREKQKEEKEELARIAKLEKEMLEAELEFLETARCLLEEQLERERKLEEKHKEELNRVRDKTRKEVEEVNTCNFTIRNRTVPYWVEYLRGY